MQIRHRFEHLLDDTAGIHLRVGVLFHNALQQLAAKGSIINTATRRLPLDGHDDLLVALVNVAILDDVLVPDGREDIRIQNQNAARVAVLLGDHLRAQILPREPVDYGYDPSIGCSTG